MTTSQRPPANVPHPTSPNQRPPTNVPQPTHGRRERKIEAIVNYGELPEPWHLYGVPDVDHDDDDDDEDECHGGLGRVVIMITLIADVGGDGYDDDDDDDYDDGGNDGGWWKYLWC